jgi:hypothetical protein
MPIESGDILDTGLHAIGDRVYAYRIVETDLAPYDIESRPQYYLGLDHYCPICGERIDYSVKTSICLYCRTNCHEHKFRQYSFYCHICWMLYDSVQVGTTTDFPDAIDYNE